MMKRPQFLGSLAAIAVATALEPVLPAEATETPPLLLGESARFRGYVLRAFDNDGELYLAYTPEALVESDAEDAVDDFVECNPNDIRSNAGDFDVETMSDAEVSAARAAEAACDGRCASRGVPLKGEPGGHDCFVIGDRIAETVRLIDAGAFDAGRAEWNTRYAHPSKRLPAWHPENAGMVAQLWSFYC